MRLSNLVLSQNIILRLEFVEAMNNAGEKWGRWGKRMVGGEHFLIGGLSKGRGKRTGRAFQGLRRMDAP